MIDEARRRAYLRAMQIDSWAACRTLPFAAPSNAELWLPLPVAVPERLPTAVQETAVSAPAATMPRAELPRPQLRPQVRPASAVVDEPAPAPKPVTRSRELPRFSQQLLRAGQCLLLVELPTGETFQGRDPAYLLLRDLLRAAGLPDSPQLVGEPVRWPLLQAGSLDQGPEMAREFVQSFVAARLEEQAPCACLWLIGASALRFAGDLEPGAVLRELHHETLGPAWTLPGLDQLLEQPALKAELWRSMRRVMRRWQSH